MTDTYSTFAPGGAGAALPAPSTPLKLTVHPAPKPKPKPVPIEEMPEWTPPGASSEASEAQAARDTAAARLATGQKRIPIDQMPEWKPPEDQAPKEPSRQTTPGEALEQGIEQGVSFGAAPALHGLQEAVPPAYKQAQEERARALGIDNPPGIDDMVIGGVRMLVNRFSNHPDPEISAAYERGRAAAQETKDLTKEQHPVPYLAGMLGGTVALPGVGALAPAAVGGRMAQGAFQGGVLGGLQNAGEAIGQGKPLSEVGAAGAKGVVIGAPTGAAIGAVIGPRLATAPGPGQRAAATAENLGAPIPKGLASDSPAIQASAAAVRSLPWFGARMGTALDRTQQAAGGAIEDIAATMAPGVTTRGAANAMVIPGLEAAVQAGRQEQDALYNALRAQIDHNTRRFMLPRTQQAINDVVAARRAAGWADPEQGLEQAQNVARGATFDGAHRARTDIRSAGGGGAPNPGYNAADFNRIERAMTADLRNLVQAAATTPTPAARRAALNAFDQAETRFGPIADRNAFLRSLADANGEAAIARLLGAARERGGDVQLLAYLRNTMPRGDFNTIGGMLLSEIGHSTRTGEFSLAQFATNWDKISDGAKRVLFDPAHRQQLEDIFNLGSHVKHAMRDTNTSHTSNTIILFDLARDAALLGVGVTTGAVSGAGVVAGGAAATPAMIFAHWISSPAQVNAMGAWSRAYRGIIGNTANPARIAAFRLATRNLANTLQLPLDNVTNTIVSRVGRAVKADEDAEQPQLDQPKAEP